MGRTEKMISLAITNDPARAADARRFVRGFLMDIEASDDDVFEALVAVEEAISNAVRHSGRPPGDGIIEIRCKYLPAEFVVQVVDDGPGFDYEQARVEQAPDPLAPGGRGLFLMNKLMDRVVVEPSRSGTVVTMTRYLNGRDDVPGDDNHDRTYGGNWSSGRELSE
ncbi:MAG: hypothetical protein GEU78_00775 [Actinobacteria bacterium]|nr:hypothetical protein [Actinomycetota bacterium]